MTYSIDTQTLTLYAVMAAAAFSAVWPVALFLLSQAIHGRRRRLEEDEVAYLVEAEDRQAGALAGMVRRVERLERMHAAELATEDWDGRTDSVADGDARV